jgi:16S rRNA processing protein RimM
MEEGQWLLAGRVGRPHGLDGSFYVSQSSPRLLDVGMSVRVGSESRVITRRVGQDSRPIIALEGCHDRPGAQALQGQALFAARGAAPTLPEDEWWVEDLEGCTVRDGERVVGTVARLLSLPSVDVLEVTRPDGEQALLVPLVGDAVRSVDVEQKEIQVDLQFLDQG